MAKKVVLVGHCGADSSFLRMAVKKAVQDAQILMADDAGQLQKMLGEGADLVLVNRELGWGFDVSQGVELIRSLQPGFGNVKMMLVSNYPDAQQAAVRVGAAPGFGKREIGTPRVTELLRQAIGVEDVVKS